MFTPLLLFQLGLVHLNVVDFNVHFRVNSLFHYLYYFKEPFITNSSFKIILPLIVSKWFRMALLFYCGTVTKRKCMPYLVDMFQKRQARDFPEEGHSHRPEDLKDNKDQVVLSSKTALLSKCWLNDAYFKWSTNNRN